MLHCWGCSDCSWSGRPFLCPAKPERRGIALPRLLSRTHVISCDTAWECFWCASCEDGDGMHIKPSKKACVSTVWSRKLHVGWIFNISSTHPYSAISKSSTIYDLCFCEDDCFDDRPGVIFHDDVSTEALDSRSEIEDTFNITQLKCPLIG